jgi:Flp pilus assembly protein TadD
LVRARRYSDALPPLERAAALRREDPGVRYQLFTAYARLGRKDDAERELSLFKRLDEERKRRRTEGVAAEGDDEPGD